MAIRRAAFLALLTGTIALLGSGPAGADYSPGDTLNQSLVHDGVERFYDVHVPPTYTGDSAVPLVVDIHGFTSNKTQQRAISGFSAASDSSGFIVAYPQGLYGNPTDPEEKWPTNASLLDADGPSWNAGDLCCGKALAESTDDVGFIRAMVTAIQTEANIDARRIYVTGLSNGGALTQVLACEAADLFAAAAPVSFPAPFDDPASECTPSRPISIIGFQSVPDQIVPYCGGNLFFDSPTAASVGSAEAAFVFWRSKNGCAGAMTTEPIAPPDTSNGPGTTCQNQPNTCRSFAQCNSGAEVEYCGVTGSSAAPYFGHILYFNDNNYAVAQQAWNFMSQHALPSSIVVVPPDLGPGDAYRLAFVTSTERNATSTEIGDCNAFVQDIADGVAELANLGTTWKAIASTATVNARDNTLTVPGGAESAPIYRLDGTRVASSYTDLWDGSIAAPISWTEQGSELSIPGSCCNVWTGTQASGLTGVPGPLGPLGGSSSFAGTTQRATNAWIAAYGVGPTTESLWMYGLSGVLIVPSEE